MRRFSHPRQPQNQPRFDTPNYRHQPLQQQQQQSHSVPENASSYVEPVAMQLVNDGSAAGIYHNGTWYNAQYGLLDAGQQSPRILQQTSNMPGFESQQTYCYQPVQLQDSPLPTAVPQAYANPYPAMDPPQSTNQQPYNYQQYQQQVQQVQPLQLIASPHNTATYYNQANSQAYQPLQLMATGPNQQPFVATSAAAPSPGLASASEPAAVQDPAQSALPRTQQHLPYNYPMYSYNQEFHPSSASSQELLQTAQALPPVPAAPAAPVAPVAPPATSQAEPFGYQYNYSYPYASDLARNQLMAAPMFQPEAAALPMGVPMHSMSESSEPQIIEIDISSATDVYITRTREKLVISIYKQRGGGKSDQPQNVYINGGIPGDTVQPEGSSKSSLGQEPTSSQTANGAATVQQELEAPAMEVAQEAKEPTESVVFKQELPRTPVLNPQNATDISVPGFQAFNVIDPSTLMECSAPTMHPSKQEHIKPTETKTLLCPQREPAASIGVDSKMEPPEQFRAPRRVCQSFDQLPIRAKSCKSEMFKGEGNFSRNPNVFRAMRPTVQQKSETIVKDILKPPPQEKSEKLLPEILNLMPGKAQEKVMQQGDELVEAESKINARPTAELVNSAAQRSQSEPKESTWKVVSQEAVDGSSGVDQVNLKQTTLEEPYTETSAECLKAVDCNEGPTTPEELAQITAEVMPDASQPIKALPTQERPKEILATFSNTSKAEAETLQLPSAQEKPNEISAISQPTAQEKPMELPKILVEETDKQSNREKQKETQASTENCRAEPSSPMANKTAAKLSKKKAKFLARRNLNGTQLNTNSVTEMCPKEPQENQPTELSQSVSNLSAEVKLNASQKPDNLPDQTDSKVTQQTPPLLVKESTKVVDLPPATYSTCKTAAQERFEKVMSETTTKHVCPHSLDVSASNIQFIPQKGANSIVLAPSKPIKPKERAELRKLLAPARTERVQCQENQATDQSYEKPKLYAQSNSEGTNTNQKPLVENKNEAEHSICLTQSGEEAPPLTLDSQPNLVTTENPLANQSQVASGGAEQLEAQANSKTRETVEQQAAQSQTQVKSKKQKSNTAPAGEADAVRQMGESAVPQVAKSAAQVKRVKLDDLMLNALSKTDEPIQPFGMQHKSNARKKPTKMSKLERKVLRREANKAQSEQLAAQMAEERAKQKQTEQQIEDTENIEKNSKKYNADADAKDTSDDAQDGDSNPVSDSEPELDCPALKDVCDPVQRRRLMIIINKIVNL